MSLGNDPSRFTNQDSAHAHAAASEAYAELNQDGPAPSPRRILAAMKRNPDGTPIGHDPEPAHRAGEIAREIVQGWTEKPSECTGE